MLLIETFHNRRGGACALTVVADGDRTQTHGNDNHQSLQIMLYQGCLLAQGEADNDYYRE
jgi:hypothetical protein